MRAIVTDTAVLPEQARSDVRQIVYRTKGTRQEWFTRLASPSDVGEKITQVNDADRRRAEEQERNQCRGMSRALDQQSDGADHAGDDW